VPDVVSGPVIPGIRMSQKTRSFERVSASSSATPRSSSSSTTKIVRPGTGAVSAVDSGVVDPVAPVVVCSG